MTPQTISVDSTAVTAIVRKGSVGSPLLVCIPGGSYTSHYFDVPGHSLLDAAAARGYTIVAVDRPGYGGSDPLEGTVSFQRNAEVLAETIGSLWRSYGEQSPGVVLIGHSMGGAIALHIASVPQTWPLLGVSITSIHYDAPEAVTQAWNSMPAGISIEFSPEQRVQFMYGQSGTHDPGVVQAAETSCAPIPVDELLEVVDGWIRDFPAVAEAIRVPVHYALAEQEQLWNSSDDNVSAFAAAFVNSPSVTAERVMDCGHNIDHHHASTEFHQRQLDWISTLPLG
jgi:pimeloyl-ACP methyl ester carboxylesterase